MFRGCFFETCLARVLVEDFARALYGAGRGKDKERQDPGALDRGFWRKARAHDWRAAAFLHTNSRSPQEWRVCWAAGPSATTRALPCLPSPPQQPGQRRPRALPLVTKSVDPVLVPSRPLTRSVAGTYASHTVPYGAGGLSSVIPVSAVLPRSAYRCLSACDGGLTMP